MGIFDFLGAPGASPIAPFEHMLLRIDGMRGSSEYEAEALDGTVTVSFYVLRYRQGQLEPDRELELRAEVSSDEFEQALAEFGAGRWDGFHGNHPRGVRDGEQFRLSMTSAGREIRADGSANFPKDLPGFRRWMDGLLRG